MNDVANMRIVYDKDELLEAGLADNPLAQFNAWLSSAAATPEIIEPNAMVLSTSSPTGEVASRSVLLKGIDARGLSFYTNYGSAKANAISNNPNVSVVFPWYQLHRQVIVIGTVTKIDRAEANEYWQTRPHLSRLGAMASAQSTIIESREILETQMAKLQEEFPEGSEVPLPENWGGFLIKVKSMEFWQGRRSRLHDRLRFLPTGTSSDLSDGHAWRVIRLSP
jgi:pyridoxamine 5'-phosphate oxidase